MMERRRFLGTGAAAMAAGAAGCGDEDIAAGDYPVVDSLAGMKLAGLRARYEDDLFGRFLPFMDAHVVDHEYGGFICSVRPDGTPVSMDKRAGWEGRGIWVYSYLYNNFAPEQKYLDIAERSVNFLMRHKPRHTTLWPSRFSREGEALDSGADTVNADLYIADGLQEFAAATGDSQWNDLARETLMKSLFVYDSDDYETPIGRGFLGKDAPSTKGMRVLDDWMLFLWIAVQMRRRVTDTDLLMLVSQCIDTITNRFYWKKTGLIHEMLAHNYNRPKNDYAQIVNIGNDLQTIWHLMAAAEQVGNRDLFDRAAGLLRIHVRTGWDDVYDGMKNLLVHADDNEWRLSKAHYVQCEALTALMRVIARTGDSWARDWYGRVDAWSRETFILDGRGYRTWLNSSDRYGTFAFDRSNRFGNYHNPRRLMLDMTMLDGLIAREGAPEGWKANAT